jgi:hypothetical protein
MKPAFHHGATIFGYVGADLFAGEPTARGQRARTPLTLSVIRESIRKAHGLGAAP